MRRIPNHRSGVARALLIAAVAVVSLPATPARADNQKPSIDLRYTTDILGTVSGGKEQRARWMGRLDLDADSGDSLLGIDGVEGHVDVMLLHGGGFSDRIVGDAQVVSNIDAPWAVRPFEAWVQARLGRGVRAKAGLIDLNSEFDVQLVGAPFLNSSFGIAPDYSQSGLNGPSIFPVTSPGLVMAVERRRWAVRAAVFDAVPGSPDHPHRVLPGSFGSGGALLAIEGEAKVGAAGELQLGYWRYTDRFNRLDGRGQGVSQGAYVQYEQTLIDKGEAGKLQGWARVGRAADRVNQIGTYAGGGVTWGTDRARLGLAVAHARLGDPGIAALGATQRVFRAETTVELTAYRRMTRWLAAQPDLQYVRHPGWGAAPDALVMGLRLHFTTAGED